MAAITKHINFSIFIAVLVCFLISCEEEYVIETPNFESKLVVNSIFSGNSKLEVHVSNSSDVLNNSTAIENVENATVEIYNSEGRYQLELLHTEDGKYVTEFVPEAGTFYTVRVSADGYKAVRATSRVPRLPKLKITQRKYFEVESQREIEVDFSIEGYNEDDIFVWEIVRIDSTEEGTEAPISLSEGWLSNLSGGNSNIKGNNASVEVSDNYGTSTINKKYNSSEGGLNGGKGGPEITTNFQVKLNHGGVLNDVEDIPDLDSNSGVVVWENKNSYNQSRSYSYELRVLTISKELYEYYDSVNDYLRTYDNSSIRPPRDVYSNVKNGFGVFAGYSESLLKF